MIHGEAIKEATVEVVEEAMKIEAEIGTRQDRNARPAAGRRLRPPTLAQMTAGIPNLQHVTPDGVLRQLKATTVIGITHRGEQQPTRAAGAPPTPPLADPLAQKNVVAALEAVGERVIRILAVRRRNQRQVGQVQRRLRALQITHKPTLPMLSQYRQLNTMATKKLPTRQCRRKRSEGSPSSPGPNPSLQPITTTETRVECEAEVAAVETRT